ncbi:alpha/beta fold hydrolase [Anaerocolumna aminovalerica]|uniref:alpha/beta fold hydrolase n=1 Tax=Anaerocolumna aminovalerica TaxID=1527 RepID=UPI00248AF76B|nr:alpha/beta hydrolase [Anaerocolumna aminovalerica]
MKVKERWYRKVWMYLLIALVILGIIITIQYKIDIHRAYDKLADYKTQTIDTKFGKMTYLNAGSGEAVLLCHGIFGGYDQAYESLQTLLGNGYRKIAPSRFGYPGSDLPSEPTPKNQAKAFLHLIDMLEIEKVYIITTSAGGASGISFAIQYPERVKGLILLSSGVPNMKKAKEEIKEMTGPPAPIVNDFPMWFTTKYLGFAFKPMFGGELEDDSEIYKTLLPVKPRKKGIQADTHITNIDMDINYDQYEVERITSPILVIHAKDDPMAKYENIEKFMKRTKTHTAIFETGGHMITGHGDRVSSAIKEFIEKTN